MSRRAAHTRQNPLRRLAAVLAVLGLVFASAFASLSHSAAMAAMTTSALHEQTGSGHDQHAIFGHEQHWHGDAAADLHHHGDHQTAGAEKARSRALRGWLPSLQGLLIRQRCPAVSSCSRDPGQLCRIWTAGLCPADRHHSFTATRTSEVVPRKGSTSEVLLDDPSIRRAAAGRHRRNRGGAESRPSPAALSQAHPAMEESERCIIADRQLSSGTERVVHPLGSHEMAAMNDLALAMGSGLMPMAVHCASGFSAVLEKRVDQPGFRDLNGSTG